MSTGSRSSSSRIRTGLLSRLHRYIVPSAAPPPPRPRPPPPRSLSRMCRAAASKVWQSVIPGSANATSSKPLLNAAASTQKVRSGTEAAAAASSAPDVDGLSFADFFSSGYAITLLILYIVTNRIHHLVPPRRPLGGPLELSTLQRITLRLPSLIVLLRVIITLSLAILNHHYPDQHLFGTSWIGIGVERLLVWSTSWTGALGFGGGTQVENMVPLDGSGGGDGGAISDAAIVWQVFVACALAVTTETFVRSLDDDNFHQTSFNLPSLTWILYAHSKPQEALPVQLYTFLLTTLLELFLLHLHATISPLGGRTYRMHITGFFSLLSQYRLLRPIFTAGITMNWVRTLRKTPSPSGGHVIDLIAEVVVVLTALLRLSAALLRRETLSMQSILGYRTHFFNQASNLDYSAALLGYATSCLVSSSLSGLANEVDPIVVRFVPCAFRPYLAPSFPSLTSIPSKATPYPTIEPVLGSQVAYVEMNRGGRSGTVGRRYAGEGDRLETAVGRFKRERGKGGLAKEIRNVDAIERDAFESRTLDGDPVRFWEMYRFTILLFRLSLYSIYSILYALPRQLVRSFSRLFGIWGADEHQLQRAWRAERDEEGDELEGVDGDYIPPKRRIGQQDDASSAESESDDDDDDRDDDECSDEGDNGVNVVAHQRDLDDDEVVEDDPSTLVSLYSDFTRGSSSDPSNIASSSRLGDKNNSSGNITDSSNFTSVLLAHLANPSASPLTRRRYQVLLRPLAPFSGSGYQHQQQLDGWDRGEGGVEQAIEGRLQELATLSKGKGKQVEGSSVEASGMQVDGAEGDSEREERERRRLCVVCVCEERTIICWPCRCLTMCEDCRESLAERMNTTNHLCITCRTPVKGFSRIYVP